ncbi:hypothetical protein K3Z92_03160, partial [Pseudomonas aeruginosa]|nr:hypothetical protein [Pseudomonas aeruginosa]
RILARSSVAGRRGAHFADVWARFSRLVLRNSLICKVFFVERLPSPANPSIIASIPAMGELKIF